MRTARRLLKQVRTALFAALMFGAAINVLMLATPLFTLQVFESVVPLGSIETLLILLVITGAAILAAAAIEIARDTILLRAALWLDHCLGSFMLQNGLRSGLPAHELKRDQRALETLRGFLASSAVAPLLDGPWVPIFLVALFALHAMIGALGVATAALLLVTALLQLFATGRLQNEAQEARDRSAQWYGLAAAGGALAAVLGLAKGATDRWETANRQHVASAYSIGKRTSVLKALGRGIRIGAQVAVYALGAWLVIADQITPGVLVASAILLARALAPIEQLAGAIRPAAAALSAYRRLKALPEDYPETPVAAADATGDGRIELSDVTVYWPGRKTPALRGVSLAIAPGECIAIVGPNGAGKSTLAAVIAGAVAPTAGSADLDGLPIARWQRGSGAPRIGYLPDDPQLVEGSVHDNITRLRRTSLMSAAAAAIAAGVHERIQTLPDGYDTAIAAGGAGLSLSERRAVALARACYGSPAVIVLDEPECGLDGIGVKALMRALGDLKTKGVGIILVTQDPRLLRLADRTVVLSGGAIGRIGKPQDVLQPVATVRSDRQHVTQQPVHHVPLAASEAAVRDAGEVRSTATVTALRPQTGGGAA